MVVKDETIEVTFFLGHPEEVKELAHNLSKQNVHERNYISREKFVEKFSKDNLEFSKWAEDNKLQIKRSFDTVASNTVKASGSKKDFEKALGIKFSTEGDYRIFSGEPKLKLPSFIESVHGLSNKPIARPHFKKSASISPVVSNQLATAYNFPTGNGAGQTVAIIELGGGYSQGDLNNYFSTVAKVAAPQVIAVGNNQYGAADGSDVEVELDIEIPGSIANQAKYVVYFAPNTDAGFLDAINQAAHDQVNKPSIISISWGGPEKEWGSAAISAMHSAFQAASVLGVTVFAASGDDGNSDGAPGLNVDYPASDPFVCGCGGTDVSSLSPLIEDAWNHAGGGSSNVFSIPPYQTVGKTRGVPDVAGLAGSPGFLVVADGQLGPVEGTSCVAPLWAGLTAILNSNLGKNIGFINPLLYQTPSSFQDITTGGNGFPASKGWDPVTGLGTPNGQLLVQALKTEIQPNNTIIVPASLSYKVAQNTTLHFSLTATDNISGVTSCQFGIIHPPTGTLTAASGSGPFSAAYFYNPVTNFTGSDSFQYQATDNIGTKSNIGQINITVATTTIPQSRYQLRSTLQKGEPVPDNNWKIVFDSGILS